MERHCVSMTNYRRTRQTQFIDSCVQDSQLDLCVRFRVVVASSESVSHAVWSGSITFWFWLLPHALVVWRTGRACSAIYSLFRDGDSCRTIGKGGFQFSDSTTAF